MFLPTDTEGGGGGVLSTSHCWAGRVVGLLGAKRIWVGWTPTCITLLPATTEAQTSVPDPLCLSGSFLPGVP